MSSLLTRRQVLASLGAAALASALGGCGGRRPMGGGRTPDGRIALTYWNGFTGPDGKTMEAMVRQFQAANPDLSVRMQIIPWSTYYDKLTLSLAYGGAPDLFILQTARFPEFASFDTLRPMEDLYAQSQPPLTAADFAAAPWQASFYGGRQYALPLDVHPMGLYYNTALFKKAGIVDAQGRAKPPVTWEEFLDAARKLTKPGGGAQPDQWGFVFANQHTNWLTIVRQFGGDMLTPDGKRPAMASPETLAGTQRMHDLIYQYKVAPRPADADAWLAFRQGSVGMAMEGIYMLASLQEQTGLAFAGAPTPQFGPRPSDWAGSHLLCQPKGLPEDRARAAWRLMRFLSDHSLTWGEGGQVPARTAVRDSAQFAALPVQSQFARQLPYVQYEPQVPQANSLGQFVDPAIEAVLLDLQTPEAAMRDADRRITELLKRSQAS